MESKAKSKKYILVYFSSIPMICYCIMWLTLPLTIYYLNKHYKKIIYLMIQAVDTYVSYDIKVGWLSSSVILSK